MIILRSIWTCFAILLGQASASGDDGSIILGVFVPVIIGIIILMFLRKLWHWCVNTLDPRKNSESSVYDSALDTLAVNHLPTVVPPAFTGHMVCSVTQNSGKRPEMQCNTDLHDQSAASHSPEKRHSREFVSAPKYDGKNQPKLQRQDALDDTKLAGMSEAIMVSSTLRLTSQHRKQSFQLDSSKTPDTFKCHSTEDLPNKRQIDNLNLSSGENSLPGSTETVESAVKVTHGSNHGAVLQHPRVQDYRVLDGRRGGSELKTFDQAEDDKQSRGSTRNTYKEDFAELTVPQQNTAKTIPVEKGSGKMHPSASKKHEVQVDALRGVSRKQSLTKRPAKSCLKGKKQISVNKVVRFDKKNIKRTKRKRKTSLLSKFNIGQNSGIEHERVLDVRPMLLNDFDKATQRDRNRSSDISTYLPSLYTGNGCPEDSKIQSISNYNSANIAVYCNNSSSKKTHQIQNEVNTSRVTQDVQHDKKNNPKTSKKKIDLDLDKIPSSLKSDSLNKPVCSQARSGKRTSENFKGQTMIVEAVVHHSLSDEDSLTYVNICKEQMSSTPLSTRSSSDHCVANGARKIIHDDNKKHMAVSTKYWPFSLFTTEPLTAMTSDHQKRDTVMSLTPFNRAVTNDRSTGDVSDDKNAKRFNSNEAPVNSVNTCRSSTNIKYNFHPRQNLQYVLACSDGVFQTSLSDSGLGPLSFESDDSSSASFVTAETSVGLDSSFS